MHISNRQCSGRIHKNEFLEMIKVNHIEYVRFVCRSTCGLVAMTSASHAEGRQFDPGQVYILRLFAIALKLQPGENIYTLMM